MGNPALRWLVIVSLVETASLPFLVVNRLTTHWTAVTTTLGPLHGFAYLTVIALALSMSCPNRVKFLALIPGVGGLLFVAGYRRAAAARARQRADTSAPTGDIRSSKQAP